ncbi:hypothetical protein G7072_04330 [Nocardioides sp. HDW12B]|uniref:hypothetical protein n=1 Tax=Nocardioides sp. HDW12B TaxID=2714939 RepID=UPI0014094349|nr:hypothetical protein [Nocardioides sp. HDW12B]QIK65669.1 hypothetical protein G7072_04330 [Nocardioides sp. HDW12B]
MTEQKNAQQFADRLRTALGKQSRRRAGDLRRRTGSSTRSFADRLRSSLDVR